MTDSGPVDLAPAGPGEAVLLRHPEVMPRTTVPERNGHQKVDGVLGGLVRLLSEAFARRGDQVLWALSPEWARGLELPQRNVRIDPAHAIRNGLLASPGSSEAVGVHEDSWVVLVLSADGREDELESSLPGQLRCFHSRFLLIILETAPAEAETVGPATACSSRTRRLDVRNLALIASELRRIRTSGTSAILRAIVHGAVNGGPTGCLPAGRDGVSCNGNHNGSAAEAIDLADVQIFPAPAPELCRREVEAVAREELTPFARQWLNEYLRLGGRSEFTWKWAQYCIRLITLPCVPEHWMVHACDTKFLAGMLNVLVDDVADQQVNGPLLTELLRLTRSESPDLRSIAPADRHCLELAYRLWNEYWTRVAAYPCSAAFSDLLRFDLQQLFNSLHYSYLVRRNQCLLNPTEDDLYSPRSMMIQCFATVDLMCTPDFPANDLGRVREAISQAECMARIANSLGTWRREITHGDFTNGVFVQAFARGDVRFDEFVQGGADAIEAIIQDGGYEQRLLRRWEGHRDRLRALAPDVKSVDLERVAAGFTRMLLTELGSRGLK